MHEGAFLIGEIRISSWGSNLKSLWEMVECGGLLVLIDYNGL